MTEPFSNSSKIPWKHWEQACFWMLLGVLLSALIWFGIDSRKPPIAVLNLRSINEARRTVFVADGGSFHASRWGNIQSWVIFWGDGSSNGFPKPPQSERHHYGRDGNFQLRLVCVDESGKISTPASTNFSMRHVTRLREKADELQMNSEKDSATLVALTKDRDAANQTAMVKSVDLNESLELVSAKIGSPLLKSEIDSRLDTMTKEEESALNVYKIKFKEASKFFFSRAKKAALEAEAAVAHEHLTKASSKVNLLKYAQRTAKSADSAREQLKQVGKWLVEAEEKKASSLNAAKVAMEAADKAEQTAREPATSPYP